MELYNSNICFVRGEVVDIEKCWSFDKRSRRYKLSHGRIERDKEPGCLKIVLYRWQ